MSRFFLAFAAASGFLSVALGAFGAHALKATLPANLLTTFNTAVGYQLSHSLALLLVVLFAAVFEARGKSGKTTMLQFSSWAFVLGILLFSGSLYGLVFSGQTMLGVVTPLGGLCFLAGWAALFVFACKSTLES